MTANGESRLSGIAYGEFGTGCGFRVTPSATDPIKGIFTDDIDAQAIAGKYLPEVPNVPVVLTVTYKTY